MDKKTNQKLKIIGIYQIIGGLIGFYPYITINFFSQQTENNFSFLLFPFFVVYLFSIFCGYLLLKKDYKRGINISIYNQAFQIIGFSVIGIGFTYVAGIFAAIKIDLTDDIYFGLEFYLSHWNLNLNSNFDLTYVSVNIIPIIILNYLFKLREIIEKNEAESIINNL